MNPLKPRLFVGMPHPGLVTPKAAHALYVPASPGWLAGLKVSPAANSIAPAGFNDLLALALNLMDKGEVTHFAMIHADVEPGPAWFDALYDEMIGAGAGLISACIAIKEPGEDPPISTAVGLIDRPRERPRRLRRADLSALPVTFSIDDLPHGPGECLLVNTGLWAADLTHPAWDAFPGFACDTWIEKGPDGRRASRVVPEDWAMSRWAARNGVKVVATQAIEVFHSGLGTWGNRP